MDSNAFLLFLLLVNLSTAVASSAARFIPAMGYAAVSDVVSWLLVGTSFAIALVSERRQDLYEIVSRRLFTRDIDAPNLKERLRLLLPSWKRLWLPEQKATILEKCAAGAISANIIIGTVSGIATLTLVSLIIYAIVQVEAGMADRSRGLEKAADNKFGKAMRACPGAANVYNQLYLYGEGQPEEQLLAVDRIVALRGGAGDYVMRARLLAREHNVTAARADYRTALSCQKSPLNSEARAEITAELSILEFKEIQL